MKWDPKQENAEHLQQSALLHTTYYWIQVCVYIGNYCIRLTIKEQIVVHRPFIPKPGESSLLNFPSLAICTSASRTSIRIMDILHQRNETGLIVMPNVTVSISCLIISIFSLLEIFQTAWINSALVMLVNLWRGRHLGSSSINLEKGLAEVFKVLKIFHLHENRYNFRLLCVKFMFLLQMT